MITVIPSYSKQRLLISDLVVAFIILLVFSIFRSYADLVLAYSWIFILLYVLVTKRILALTHLIIATLVAIVWLNYAKEYYGYSYAYHKILGMNLLPLMAWTLSLFGLSEVFNYLTLSKKRYRFLLFIPVFWIFLITFETIAYHVLEIRNTTTGSFVGLPYCNCIHAPTWMKVVYFSMGPAYYGATLQADNFIAKMK
jgi:hypothetical protein